jgi:hypothetical protein
MEDNVQKLANAGQPEDSQIIHAAPGEMVVPPVISEQTQQMINQDLQSVGLNPAEYMVGQGSVNNLTGLQEFGFLSKLFKKVKKVVKKVAPIALVATGVAGLAGAGPLAGALGKGAAGKGLGLKGTSGKFFGKGGTFRNILSRGREFILPGKDKKGLIRNIFGGGISGNQSFGEIKTGTGEFGEPIYTTADGTELSVKQLQEAGYTFDAQGNPIAPTQTIGETGPFGLPLGPRLRKRFLGDDSQPIFGQQTGTQTGGGLGLGGTGGLAALAALYGLATKKQAEKTEGGLRDIRLSVRPDLMPQQVFQGFDVGVRPGMQQGNAVFDVSVRNPENERFAFMVLQSNDPDILNKLDDIDKQKFEHGLIMSGEFGLFTDATRGKNYMPSSAFQNIMRANATAQTKIPQMLYGGRMDEQELDLRMGGPSEGPGTETSDDIPAMLSDGEFVMTAAANKGLGGFKIEKNKDSLTIFPTGKPDREQGFKNNDKLMKFFEDYQEMMS